MSVSQIQQLSFKALLFPLALVLYEFATYIGNDMILPGMPAVVHEFGAASSLVPTGMSAYLAGGVALQWLLGPLSDRIGRRPVMLAGAAIFIASCLLILLSNSIASFLLLRFIQGFGLCYLMAVGYAAIQEAFTEVTAIRVTALMANVALISPLIGPLAGAVIIEYCDWRWVFVSIAVVASLGLAGLYLAMPETSPRLKTPLNLAALWQDYSGVYRNRHFLAGALALTTAGLPLLAWLGQSPVILMQDRLFSALDFGLWQIPVFAGLIMGNIVLATLVSRMPLTRLLWLGMAPLCSGLCGVALASWLLPGSTALLVGSFALYALGCGISSAGLYRLVLFASPASKGTVAAALGMLSMLGYTLGIEIAKLGYALAGIGGFAMLTLLCAPATVALLRYFLHSAPAVAATTMEN